MYSLLFFHENLYDNTVSVELSELNCTIIVCNPVIDNLTLAPHLSSSSLFLSFPTSVMRIILLFYACLFIPYYRCLPPAPT